MPLLKIHSEKVAGLIQIHDDPLAGFMGLHVFLNDRV